MLAAPAFSQPEFLAPPPSPESVDRRSKVAEDVEREGFVCYEDNAAAVPELVLPVRPFPRQIHLADPPEFDFQLLGTLSCIEQLRSAARTIGCFQIVNHGIPLEVIAAAEQEAATIFRWPQEKKTEMGTSSGSARRCAFGGMGEGEGVHEELFWWQRGVESCAGASESEFAGIWHEYQDFSRKMDRLHWEVEKIACKVGRALFSEAKHQSTRDEIANSRSAGEEANEPTLVINKYGIGGRCTWTTVGDSSSTAALRHDAISLFIRSCEHPHVLGIHVARRFSGFRVFSKSGSWGSFRPNNEALVVTIGNQQMPITWRGSLYKHVVGKPIFSSILEDEDFVSVSVLYSWSAMKKLICSSATGGGGQTISLAQQAISALLLTLLYHLVMVYLCHNV